MATPTQIKLASETGIPSTWNIGDSQPIVVDGFTYNIEIYDLQEGRYDKANGSKTNIVLGFREITETRQWHTLSDNTYAPSSLRTYLNGDFISKLPQEWQDVLEDVMIPTATAGSQAGGNVIQYLPEKLFIPSEMELFGNNNYSHPGEGTQFDYYVGKENSFRVKQYNGSNTTWWLRSPNRNLTYLALIVNSSGGMLSSSSPSNSRGVSACFAL